jgi:pimeloyl-ACP methyl ester carboxylesterase
MSDLCLKFLSVGTQNATRRIAVRQRDGAAPGLFWLGGFKSDMRGIKAEALDRWGQEHGRAVVRFDYSGHGESGGDFTAGSIGRWLEESLAVLDACCEGPQVVVGSSMGGWLALLATRLLNEAEPGRVAGLILIAPAVDMSEALIWDNLDADARRMVMEDGAWRRPNPWLDEPDVFSRAFFEDGRKHLLFGGMIRTRCPVIVLQGMQDEAVPYAHALKLMERLGGDPATLTLVKDGDHRLSRPEDLALLFDAVGRMLEGAKG